MPTPDPARETTAGHGLTDVAARVRAAWRRWRAPSASFRSPSCWPSRRVRHRSAQRVRSVGRSPDLGRQLRFPRSRPPAARLDVHHHAMGHYIPLTWADVRLDYVLWACQPAATTSRTSCCTPRTPSVFTGWAKRLLYAARPLRARARCARASPLATLSSRFTLATESVAWATERRDVLSGLLFLTCVLTYLRAASAEGARRRRCLRSRCGLRRAGCWRSPSS